MKKSVLYLVFILVGFFNSNSANAQCVGAPVPNDACYQWVIGIDPYCCNTFWDGICQNEYDGCVPPPPPGCAVAAPVPDDACYQLVISTDPTCCDNAWTAACQDMYDNCGSTSFTNCGSVQNFTVPPCVTQINVVVSGAGGGGFGAGGGAEVSGNIPVTPGQNLQVSVGCQGGYGANSGGYGGGGNGQASGSGWASYGGGGASYVSTGGGMAGAVVVAGGGGGIGGGDDPGQGGDGGCPGGTSGTTTYGYGGGGGTAGAGGAGGAPWTAGGGAGQSGSFGQGGAGGVDLQYGNNPGGGGGGGYYGGGGGGSDNISGTFAVGGGGGGGGSSLVPAGFNCTSGANTGNGSVTIAYIIQDPIAGTASLAPNPICEGQTTTLTLTGYSGTIQWQSSPNAGGPWSNIGGATSSPYTTGPIASNTCFRAVVSNCGSSVNSNVVCVTVDSDDPIINCPGNLTAVCSIAEQPAYATYAQFTAAGGSASDPSGNLNTASFTLLSQVSNGLTCPQTVTRTYQIADLCGHTATCTQLIVIDDNINPTGTAPANVTVQCMADVPPVNVAAITNEADNCGVPTVTHISDNSVGSCPTTITRTYRITDVCGNFIDVQQIITVDDTQAPVFSAPPGPITVECIADVPAMTNLAYTDNCDPAGSVPGVDGALVGGSCGGTITRTWTYTDNCGNTATQTQIITVDDNTNPTASNPAPVTVQCMALVPAVNVAVVTDEADNCDPTPTVTHVSDTQAGTCPTIITRTYRITDDCGNITDVTQTITVDDTTNPTASAPAPVSVQCMADVPPVNTSAVIDEADNCTANPVVTHISDTQSGGTCPVTIDRVYRITDDCGNFIDVTQVITVNDNIAPTGTAPAPVSVQCMADVPAVNTASVTGVSDNCTVNPTVTHISDTPSAGTCPITIDRLYRITDDCGNITDVTQVITVNDNIAPTGTAPGPITVECAGDVPAANTALVTGVSDNCTANPTVTFIGDASNGGICPEIITRTYEIEDECGNVTTVTQTITVDDTTPPTASNPPNISIAGGAAPAPDPLVVTDEADNCDPNPMVTWISDVTDGLNCPETITRTYEIEDDCGNTTQVQQLIVIGDAIPPSASNPANINVECIGDVPLPDPAVVTDEADNGGVPTVAWDNDASDGNSCPETITRTYSVTDNCGNVIYVTQNIVVLDVTAPLFAAPPVAVSVQCSADVPAMTNLAYTDNCDPAGSVTGTDVSDGNTCPETITRTWTYTDACGNTSSVSQNIIVDDTTPPTGTAPANVSVQCSADVPASNTASVTGVSDNCTAVPTVNFVSDASNGLTCPEIITRTYEIVDDCGNTTTVTQTITVDDTTNPTASNPAQTIVPGGPAPAPDPNVVVDEADNCTANPVVAFVSQVSDNNPCPETITYTYSVTDDCGNQITVTHEVLITDPIAPTGTAPADITVECIGDVPAADPALITDEADNNGAPTVTHLSDVSDGNTCPEVITRTYRITDPCGNFIDVVQLITVNDITAPTASNPVAVNVECIADVPGIDVNVVTDEADNCTAVPAVTHISDVSDGNTCPEVITRTYRITDDCGNITDVTQTITVNDVTPPTGTAPANLTVQCSADVPASNTALVTGVSDNCTAVPAVNFVSDASNGLTCPEIITRTYEIVDDCGNTTTVTQTITVDDTTNPTASNPAQTIVPGGPAPAPDPNVVIDEADNCTANPVVAFVSQVSDNNPCPETITYTYSVTDDCGNQITVTHEVLITDPILPTGTAPANITVECIGDVPLPDPALITDEADNNGVPIVAFVSDVSDNGSCPEIITRTYSITDQCGNQILVTQLITVLDTTNPTASNPVAVNVECIADVPAVDVAVVTDEADNCTAVPTVTHISDASDGLSCPETITRTYRITDDCGNFSDVTQTIIVNDVTSPAGTAPASITVECSADVPAPNTALVTGVSDNCTAVPTVNFVSDISDNNTCPETITRTYEIVDDCGNTTTVTQTIIVDDTTNPTASNPATININAGNPVPASDPLVVTDEADNCTANPIVAFVGDVSDNQTCPETITRTYSITDDCGNQITVDQLIIISDPIAPTATAPAAVNVECIGDVPVADPLIITDEADNSGVAPIVAFVGDVSDGNTCPETITRTYSVTDDCGNQILLDQIITVNDITNPTASNPVAVNVECIGDVPAIDVTVVTDEADNCTVTPSVSHISDVSDGNTCPETITRTYRVTDDCGNFIDVTQTITVNDITAPLGTAPANVTVQCSADVPAPNTALVTGVSDNCTANPAVNFVSDVSDGLTCPETITRTYAIIDDCGNTTNVTQTIVVDDITNPTASNPASVTVQCIGDVPAVDVTVVTDEADNCTVNPTVTHQGDVQVGSCPIIITRTYRVEDDCNNFIDVTQTITVDDTTDPVANTPAPITVACASDIPVVDPAVVTGVSDNCTANPIVALANEVTSGSSCINQVITRTYSITDDCGNQITVDHVITVDAAMPTVEAGVDQSVCDGTPVTLTASNYPGNATISWDNGVSDGISFTPSVGTITYTVIADVCSGQCVITDNVNVEVNPIPVVAFTADTLIGCEPLTVNFTNLSTEQYNCVWDMGDGNTINSCGQVGYTFDAGTYNITLTVTSSAGCTDSYTEYSYIYVTPYPEANFIYSPTEIDITDTEVDFTNLSTNADYYEWSFGYAGSAGSTDENPTHYFPDNAGGQYTVTLLAGSNGGCSDQISIIVHIKDVVIFYIPNTFTPDGNDVNNEFTPVFTSGVDIYDYHLTIFNRWGEIVFESYNLAYGWNGHYGDGGLVDDGTYVWQVEFGETMTDKKQTHRGHVTVLK
ncbi:MAG: gliding motility-associated C-terminal domain-containing protein [Crocinitomicaceae bacterium]|nr:gliding motility-associated C-terminal domain-containing protein [Crocinitomicaceae bacterium]